MRLTMSLDFLHAFLVVERKIQVYADYRYSTMSRKMIEGIGNERRVFNCQS